MMALLKPVDISESRSCFGSENISYESSFPYRGIAIIATFGCFHSSKLRPINGIEKDRKLLEDGFKKLHYGVVVWRNIMKKERFFKLLERVADDTLHEKCESFALAIITHGGENGKLHAYDTDFRREDVYNFFKAGNCRGLENKLKLFIFHACRGDTKSKGVHLSGRHRHHIQRARLGDYIDKDFLILCSTTEDNVAFGPLYHGSGFIICLYYAMKAEAEKPEGERQHMLDLLHDVINYTAGLNFGDYRQQPVLIYSLDQFYHLKEKKAIPQELLRNISTTSD